MLSTENDAATRSRRLRAMSAVPMIATRVGGIPEIYGPLSDSLVAPEDAGALAKAIARAIDQPAATADIARSLRERVAASFSVESMVDGVLSAYQTALAGRRPALRGFCAFR